MNSLYYLKLSLIRFYLFLDQVIKHPSAKSWTVKTKRKKEDTTLFVYNNEMKISCLHAVTQFTMLILL